ncbi:hypothetical protein Mgra_00002457 [Meloidogyne graminicola]|uniref:Uncharacterized protein n=1 Tax=Meloidogyne graminicola TaxID=189291 RepID=A0A8S9ZW96_9BILA|nr:hypothetical protein Mgra_00002457 [Meloidogyne graminicola]
MENLHPFIVPLIIK